MNKNMLYRSIPKVDVLLEDPEIQGLIETYSRDTVVESIHLEMDALRKYIGTCEDEEKAKEQILKMENAAAIKDRIQVMPSMFPISR